jgi:hypothetical protein
MIHAIWLLPAFGVGFLFGGYTMLRAIAANWLEITNKVHAALESIKE